MINHFVTFWLNCHWTVFCWIYFWIACNSLLGRVWFIKLQKFSSQCLHCPSISWQNYPWFSLIERSGENGHPIRAFIVSNIHSCLRFLEAFSMCCVVLAWESCWSWPTWPVNLAHSLSVSLSDFCSPGFWDKICRCLCPLDIPWNAKFLGTLKPMSLLGKRKTEPLTVIFHEKKFCFMRYFWSTLVVCPKTQCNTL